MPPYAKIPTLMRLPVDQHPRGRDIVVVGAPYDGGGDGGRAERTDTGGHPAAAPVHDHSHPTAPPTPDDDIPPDSLQSDSLPTDFFSPVDCIDCVDGGDLDLADLDPCAAAETVHAHVSGLLARNAAVLLLTGDRSLSVAALRAVASLHGPLALLRLTVHAEPPPAAPAGHGPHGGVLRRAVDEGLVRQGAAVRIGLPRGPGLGAAAQTVRERMGRRPVYVSVDLGAWGAPGARVPDGATAQEVLEMLHCVGDLYPVGFDVTGLSPLDDRPGAASALAAEIGTTFIHQYARAHRIRM